MKNKKIGVLAVQGSFMEHIEILEKIKIDFVKVRDIDSLKEVTHLIIPGGESTTIIKLLKAFNLWDYLKSEFNNKNLFILGTCAGAILISRLMNDKKFLVERNSYGGQQSSFVANLQSSKFPNLEGVFIRAPRFKNIKKEEVKVLASFQNEPVLLEGANFLAMSFHPEILGDTNLHKYFLEKFSS